MVATAAGVGSVITGVAGGVGVRIVTGRTGEKDLLNSFGRTKTYAALASGDRTITIPAMIFFGLLSSFLPVRERSVL